MKKFVLFLEWCWCSWQEIVRLMEQHRVHGRGNDGGGPGEIKREVILLLLHVLIHLLWCYYSFHFHLLARHTRNVHT